MIAKLNICANFCVVLVVHDRYYKHTYILEYLKNNKWKSLIISIENKV